MNGMARVARGEKHSTLTLRVDGSSERLRIQELELTQLPGALSVKGAIELGKPLRWTLDAQARAFDPSLFFDDWPGALDFDLATQGHWPEAGPRAEFKLARLQGRLRARTISGSGDVALGPDLKPSGRVRLQSGGATLEATATSGARPGIDARLEVASLEEWHKDLRGKVSAEANSLGRWPNIELEARVTASQVRQGDTAFDAATFKLSAQNARAPRGSAELSAQGLTLAGFKFSDVSAKLNGDTHAHDIALDARGEPLSLALRAHGSLSGRAAQSRWAGTIGELGLDVARVPPLKLTEPAQLTVSRDSLELANTCLKGDEIAVCAAVRRDPRSFAANYSVRALPLGVLVALAAPDAAISVQGTFEGSGDLHRSGDDSLSGRATLNSATGALSQRGDDKALVLEYRDFGIDVDLSRDTASAKLRGILPRQGELEGALTLAMAESDPSLGGRAALKLRDLAPLAIWVPQLANLRGSGEIAAEVAGTLRAPRVGLTVRATGLDTEVPMLGVHLREGNFNATLEPGGRFQAEGSIASGEGTLRISGTRVEPQGLELKLSGSNFLAANIPGARVTMAPDLALVGKSGSLALTGVVKIDDADVNLEKLSLAHSYRASPDVVIVDREVKVQDTSLGLTTDMRVILGDRVKLVGFGLDSTLNGELRVLEERDQPSRATGEIRVLGAYEAFGRKLTIERGRLQFAGTSLDDPQLDILAGRKLEDVTAKLRVTGTAQNPKLDVFTDPATSQTDAMSYLLTGKAASEAHGEEGQMVSSAAQSVGSVLGNRLAKKLGGTVVPNAFTVALSSSDLQQFEGVQDSLARELGDAAREHARDEGYAFMGPVEVELVGRRPPPHRRLPDRRADGRGRRRAPAPDRIVLPNGDRFSLTESIITIGRHPDSQPGARRPQREPQPRRDPAAGRPLRGRRPRLHERHAGERRPGRHPGAAGRRRDLVRQHPDAVRGLVGRCPTSSSTCSSSSCSCCSTSSSSACSGRCGRR